jgi:hypothetical protein
MLGWITKCLDVIAKFNEFSIHHIYRHENSRANDLVQQASSYNVSSKNFNITKKQMCAQLQNLESLSILSAETGLTGSSTGLTDLSRAHTDLTDSPISLIGHAVSDSSDVIPWVANSAPDDLKCDKVDVVDWRKHSIDYLHNPSQKVDRKVWQLAFKFALVDGHLYHRTADDLLLKCLDSDQAKVDMGEVHEQICGAHQSTPKMKWLIRRGGFYWPTMIADCFRYYKGCEECQKFGNIQLAPTAMMTPIIKPWPFRGWGSDFIG